MVIRLDNGGTVTVSESGITYRRGREIQWRPLPGGYSETADWLDTLANGSAGVLFTSRKA